MLCPSSDHPFICSCLSLNPYSSTISHQCSFPPTPSFLPASDTWSCKYLSVQAIHRHPPLSTSIHHPSPFCLFFLPFSTIFSSSDPSLSSDLDLSVCPRFYPLIPSCPSPSLSYTYACNTRFEQKYILLLVCTRLWFRCMVGGGTKKQIPLSRNIECCRRCG